MSIEVLNSSYLNKKYKRLGFQQQVNSKTFVPYKLSKVSIPFANAIRRICMSEIPTYAFDSSKVSILSNTSQYNNQVLVDRMGFICLDMNQLMKYAGQNPDQLKFMICDLNDPNTPFVNNNTDASIVKITCHSHISVFLGETKLSPQQVKDIIPYDHLLMTLNSKEHIHCSFYPVKGIMRQHAQWQSSQCYYKYETKYDADDNHLETNDEQMDWLGKETGTPSGFILHLESVGKLPCNEVMTQALSVLSNKLEFFKSNVLSFMNDSKQINPAVSYQLDANIPNLLTLKIVNEDHTLGNLLADFCLKQLNTEINKVVSSPQQQIEVLTECLSSYRKPHPLDNYCNVMIRTPQTVSLKLSKLTSVSDISVIQQLPSLHLLLLAVEQAQSLCVTLLKQLK